MEDSILLKSQFSLYCDTDSMQLQPQIPAGFFLFFFCTKRKRQHTNKQNTTVKFPPCTLGLSLLELWVANYKKSKFSEATQESPSHMERLQGSAPVDSPIDLPAISQHQLSAMWVKPSLMSSLVQPWDDCNLNDISVKLHETPQTRTIQPSPSWIPVPQDL